MATTKINGSSSANNFGFYANVVVGDLNTSTNKFPVTINLYLVNNGIRTNSGGWTKSITCDGVTTSASSQTINTTGVAKSGGVTQVYTASFSVSVKSTINVSASLTKSSYTQYDPGRCSLSGSVSMPKAASIWSKSLLSIPNIANSFTLPINKYVSTYYNVAEVRNSNNTLLIKTINNAVDGTSVTFTQNELNTIYTMDNNSKQLPLRFYIDLKTYTNSSKSSQVGATQRLTCEASLVNAEPTLTFTEEEIDNKVLQVFGGQPDVIERYASDLQFLITAIPKNGATISSVSVNNQPAVLQSENTYITVIQDAQADNYSINVVDSRGLSTSSSFSKPVVNYILPTIESWGVKREGQTSSNLVLNAVINAYNDSLNTNITNNVVIQYSIDNTNWITIPSTDYTYSNNKITINNLLLQNLISHQVNGTFYLKTKDLLTEFNDNKSVPVGIYTFAKSDRKVRINGTLEIADVNAQNRFEIRDRIIVDSGSNANGDYVKYGNGDMICHKIVTGTVNITTAWGNGYTTGANNTISLGNFPAYFISRPTVNVTLERGSSNCWLISNINVGTQTAGIVSLARFTSATNVAYTLNVIAIGRWKE